MNQKQRINEIVIELPAGKVFSRELIKKIYKEKFGELKDSTFNWILYNMCNDKLIRRIGHNLFRLYDIETLYTEYFYQGSFEIQTIKKLINDKYPLVDYCIWETILLNEFLNHQLAKNTIFVEVEKGFEITIFEFIKQELSVPVLLKPERESLLLYSGDITVAVLTLVSGSPTSKNESRHVAVEKVLIDLFANKYIEDIISRGEYSKIFEEVFSKYSVNEKAMFRYAGRRGKEKAVKDYISNNTKIKLSIREAL